MHRCQSGIDSDARIIKIFLCRTDGAVPVNIPCQFFTQISVGSSLRALCQHICSKQRINPHLPVLTTHYCHSISNFFFCGLLQCHFFNNLLVGIHSALCYRLTDRLQDGIVYHACFWMLAARRGEAINHQIHLSHVRPDYIDGFLLHLIREGITIDMLCIQPLSGGELVESSRVVPSSGASALLVWLFFKENTQCSGSAPESRCNA